MWSNIHVFLQLKNPPKQRWKIYLMVRHNHRTILAVHYNLKTRRWCQLFFDLRLSSFKVISKDLKTQDKPTFADDCIKFPIKTHLRSHPKETDLTLWLLTHLNNLPTVFLSEIHAGLIFAVRMWYTSFLEECLKSQCSSERPPWRKIKENLVAAARYTLIAWWCIYTDVQKALQVSGREQMVTPSFLC